jgi:hypothetical protein
VCQHPAPRVLEEVTKIALVIYYRCVTCGHVWNIPKDMPDAPIKHVTEIEPKHSDSD